MAADGVGADVRTAAVLLFALVDVQTGGLVRVQVVAFVAGTDVAAQQVHAVVGAVVTTGQALVYVDAVLLVVRHEDVAGRALAVMTALGVDARVRAAGIDVVLKLFALVDILAGPAIRLQPEADRTGAMRFSVRVVLVTVMGTIAVIALATVHQNAGLVVARFQRVSRRTQTPERTH